MQQIKYSIKFSPSSIPNEQFIIVWLLQIIIIYNYRNFSILFVSSLDYASFRDWIRRLIIERKIYISFRTTYGDSFRHKGFFPPLLLSTRLDSTKIDPSSNRNEEFMSFRQKRFRSIAFPLNAIHHRSSIAYREFINFQRKFFRFTNFSFLL